MLMESMVRGGEKEREGEREDKVERKTDVESICS